MYNFSLNTVFCLEEGGFIFLGINRISVNVRPSLSYVVAGEGAV